MFYRNLVLTYVYIKIYYFVHITSITNYITVSHRILNEISNVSLNWCNKNYLQQKVGGYLIDYIYQNIFNVAVYLDNHPHTILLEEMLCV